MADAAGHDYCATISGHAQIFLTIRALEIEVFLSLAANEAAKITLLPYAAFYRTIFLKLCTSLIDISREGTKGGIY